MATRAATAEARKRPTKRNGNPSSPGRPHDLDKPIPSGQGDSTIPAAEAIIREVRAGLTLGEAAISVGIDRSVAYRWRGDGAAVRSQLHEGRLDPGKLTDYQQAVAAFYDDATRAEAEFEALNATRLNRAAAGGFVTTREVEEYDGKGKLLGKKVTRATTPPDPRSAMFLLERRAPSRWGRAVRVEHAVGAEGPLVQTESPLDKLAEALAAIERRREAGRAQLSVIETTGSEEQAS